MRRLLALALVALAAPSALAQSPLWQDVAQARRPTVATIPTEYRTVALDRPALDAQLATLAAAPDDRVELEIPLPEGGLVTVQATESSILAPALQARYPQIRTYIAVGPGSIHGRLSVTPAGFAGLLFTPDGAIYVDADRQSDTYIVYRADDLVVDPVLRGRADDVVLDAGTGLGQPRRAARNGETLRTYRLAVAATGEYTQFHGGTVAGALGAIVTTMNRVTGLYERDLSVSFTLVATNDQVVYTNASTDPYSNNDGIAMLGQNQTNLNSVIGNANYDIGHVFSTGGGGVASLGSVCSTSFKARGVTGSAQPTGDAFDVDYVAHEIGHQFGGNHTFNGSTGACSGGNRNGPTAYEPGSGTTIMAYAGICGNQNLQSNSDPVFHGASLDEITAFITTGGGSTCGTTAATGNTLPTASVPTNVTIPAGTPFSLTGSATDDTPGTLTYAWEEFDLGGAGAPGTQSPPFFRAYAPVDTPTRVFPQRDRLVAGLAPVIGETLPTGSRTLTFRMTARDNAPGGGAFDDATMTVTTVAGSGPFAVTFADTPGQSYATSAVVTWNVAGTNAAPVSTSLVDILFSDDNGQTFRTVLASGTPNDGSHTVTFPSTSTTQGRILVRAVGNVFFNVNAEAFEVTNQPPPQIAVAPLSVAVTVAPGEQTSSALAISNTAAPGASGLDWSASVVFDAARLELAWQPVPDLAKGETEARGATVAMRSGGPDAFGYSYADSDEPGVPSGGFQDISGTGTAITFSSADDGTATVALPFAFPFYGTDRTSAVVSTNGFLQFASSASAYVNAQIPRTAEPNAVIAPYWDDLHQRSGTAYTGTLADGRFVIQWTNWGRYEPSTGQSLTFQAILSPDGAIEIHYGTITTTVATSATVGIENDGGTDGLEVVYNAAYIVTDKSIRFAPPAAPWLAVAPASGAVAPGASQTATLTFDAADLAEGVYTATVVVTSNDPSAPMTDVDVRLTVQGGVVLAQITGDSGTRMLAPPASGMTVADLAAINLVIGIPGYNPQRAPNLRTTFDGTRVWTPATGASEVLPLGRGFLWNLSGADRDYGSGSVSRPFPSGLVSPPANTADVPLAVETRGNRVNVFGNPFDTDLDITDVASWPNGTKMGRAVFQWDMTTRRWVYDPAVTTVPVWTAFFIRTRPGRTGTVTIPASARVYDAGRLADYTPPFGYLRFELDGATPDGQPLGDGALVLTLADDASSGLDAGDEDQPVPISDAYVVVGFGGGDALKSVESRAPGDGPFEVPIALSTVGASQALTLRWQAPAGMPDGWSFRLVDRLTGWQGDLDQPGSYRFEMDSAPARTDIAYDMASMPSQGATTRFVLRASVRDAQALALAVDGVRPNPVSGAAQVTFTVPETGSARVSVFDVRGRRVAVLSEGPREAGSHRASLDTSGMAAGVYVVRLETAAGVASRRIVVAR